MTNASAKTIWKEYKQLHPDAPDNYVAWAFGDSKEMADELLELVLNGTKTATASNYSLYGEEDELPYPGLHNILLDGNGEAKAIVVTTDVDIVPFDEVTEEHAYLEGEGDRSLEFWRKSHEDFFTREMEEANLTFHTKIPVVCERFKLVYKK